MSSGAGVVAALDGVLDRLAAADPADLPDLSLVRRVAALQHRLDRLHGLLIRDIAVAHARGAAAVDGFSSTQALLRRRLRLDARQAARQVTVAATVNELPDTAAALAGGDISVRHAAAICQARRDLGPDVLAGGAEELLLAEAREQPPARLWRLTRVLRERLDPDADRDGRLFRHRWLDVARTLHGMVSVQGMLDPATGELLMTALGTFTPAADRPAATTSSPLGTGPLGTGPSGAGLGRDSRTAGQRRADGLADLCRAALGAADGPSTGEHRPHVTVTVPLDTLRGTDPAGPDPAVLGPTGEPIGAATARRLACDAGIIPAVSGSRSEPLDIGRLSRTVPTGMRRALALRDRGCRFPGCDRPPHRTDAHHIQHWSRNGPTTLPNLALLCDFHHWLVHEGHWTLHYHQPTDTLTAHRPDGTAYDLTSGPRSQSP